MPLEPITRKEQFYARIAGDSGKELEPITRTERFLQRIIEKGAVSPEQVAEAVGEWLEENLATPSTPPIDSSLSVTGAAADAKATGDAINNIRGDLNEITETRTKTITTNEPQEVEENSGYYWNGAHSSTSYFYVHLTDLVTGDKIVAMVDPVPQPMRFVDAYLGSTRVASAGSSTSDIYSYTIPEGVDNIYVSCYVRYQNRIIFYLERTSTVTTIRPKGIGDLNSRVTALENVIDPEKNTIVITADSLLANNRLTCAERIDNKKNCSYIVWANFETFDTLTVAHGYTSFGGSYIVIDNTNIVAYYYNGSQAVVMGTYAHGLTLSDFIQVNIKVPNTNNLRATISIMTASGMFTQSNVPFGGCNGNIFTEATMAMTNVKMQYVLADMKSDVYIFGDSYTSLGDPNRYTYQLMAQGYTDMLISGYSGASSSGEIVSLRNILAISKPKYLIWALGMNDSDTASSYNASWKTCLDEVVETCANKGIELILATIPNVPNISNYYKNEYVRNSGFRYIDFAKAVGAEEVGSTWYTGMLSSDNVHPDQLGAKALASRFLVDVPEII